MAKFKESSPPVSGFKLLVDWLPSFVAHDIGVSVWKHGASLNIGKHHLIFRRLSEGEEVCPHCDRASATVSIEDDDGTWRKICYRCSRRERE